MRHRPSSPALRGVPLLLAVCAALLTAPARSQEAASAATPAPTASAGYSTRDYEWRDAARQRQVPVRLYLPDAARPDQPVPLVVFSHGIGGSRAGYSYLGRYWASQGLDQLLGGELAPRLDGQRIVAAGHSYGANTTLLAAGATVQRNGTQLRLRDPRIKAAIVLSAPPFYGEASPQQILGPVRVPSLHVTATEDIIRIPGYYSGADDRVAVFDATGSARKTLAVFHGGSHSMFTDRAGTGGVQLNPQVKEATRELSLAFLNSVFKGDEAALAAWPAQFAGIVARYTRSTP
ncbi:MAG: hypothetical protein MUF16_28565 [Burkholderiaceae bacterium]|nr:hypothetical protein [Burkholderiaceae bacterium]